MQTRMHLPVWLGIGDALRHAQAEGKLQLIQDMYQEWPFFQVRCARAAGRAGPAAARHGSRETRGPACPKRACKHEACTCCYVLVWVCWLLLLLAALELCERALLSMQPLS